MNNSNWTLRFPRTYREAKGHDCHFSQAPNLWLELVIAIGVAFMVGVLVGLLSAAC